MKRSDPRLWAAIAIAGLVMALWLVLMSVIVWATLSETERAAVGDVLAGGRTPTEVAASIQKGLATYVRDPQVAVILTELRSHEYLSRVRVTGAVRQPVSIPYRPGMTVLDAVLAAGGVTEFASANRSNLYRRNGDTTLPPGASTLNHSYQLDDAPEFERFFFVTSTDPIDTKALLDSLEQFAEQPDADHAPFILSVSLAWTDFLVNKQ